MPYDAHGNYYANSTADAQQPGGVDNVLAQIPLIGGWSGAQGRAQSYQDARAADTNRSYFDTLQAPTAGDLDSQQGRDAETQALQHLQSYQGGSLTGADRGALESGRQRNAQAAGSQQRSLMQSAQARGVGGSGLDFATRQQASQLGQQQSSDAESQALAMAQQRGLSASTASAGIGSQMRQEQQNGPTQQAYEDQMQRAAGATGQYGTDASARQSSRDRQHQTDQSWAALVGSL
jgi:hypothetical protein